MSFLSCPEDGLFGPTVTLCRDGFDFTLKFERIFLSILPASFLVVLSLLRVYFLSRQQRIVRGTWTRACKLILAAILGALNLALLVMSSTDHHPQSLFITSTAITFASSLSLVVLLPLEHSRSVRPSILIQLILSLTLLFDIAQTRTLWLASSTAEDFCFTRNFTATVAIKAAIILLESHHKVKWIQWDNSQHNPEEISGIFGLAAYTWLNCTFAAGYTKILTLKDLPPLDERMTTGGLQRTLMTYMKASKAKKERFVLVKALAKTLKMSLLLPIPARIALTGFRFCQPFLIETLLDYLQEPAHNQSKNSGYGLIGAAILIYSSIAVSTSIYWYFHERTLCMSRASLAGAVYIKTTETKLSSAGDSVALTLMSTDVERIRLGFLNLHEFWANTIEVALASWLLERQINAAFIGPLVVVIVCITCAAFVNRYTGRRQKAWMDKIQKRVGLTANVISNMKHLKISGLARPVEKLIQNMRVDELETASMFRTVYVIVVTFGYAPLALCPVITFAITSRTLDVTTIFTSVSYLLLLADPLTYLFQNTPNLLAAFACLDRIQAFLISDPRADCRIPTAALPATTNSERSEPGRDMEEVIMRISSGNFGWDDGKPTLKNIDLRIPEARLTLIVGPVASGKSTLCKALLGELAISQGQITMSSDYTSRKIGYCDQTPYLSNSTIKQNIIGFSRFDNTRYREVIEAAMLLPDLSILPDGDQTKVGSSGITLSGGQKQRVALARALYLETEFYIFDDILSGLDADTSEQVFHRVFGPSGLLRRRNATVVLSTHTIKHLPAADHIVALGEHGMIVEQGTFDQLIANENYVHSLEVHSATKSSSLSDQIITAKNETRSPEIEETAVAEVMASSYLDESDRIHGDSTVYKYYLSSLGRLSITAFIVFGLGWGFFYNWGNVWLRFWSEDVTSSHPSHTNAFYIGLYAVFQLSYLASMFFSFLICFRTMIEVSGSALHKAALATVIDAPLSFFATADTGMVTNLFSQDMTLIDNELPIAVTNLACDIANALGMAAVIASSSPWLAISYPFLFVLLYIIQKFYLRTSRQLRLLDLEAKSPMYTHFLDTIRGMATFRAFGWVSDGIDLNNKLLDTSQQPTYLLAMVQRWLGFSLQCVVALLAVGVVTLATQLNSGTGLTGASLVTLMTLGDILNYIIRWYTQIETSIGAVSRLKNFSEKVKSEALKDEDIIPPPEWPVGGTIELSGVSASYSADTQEISDETEIVEAKALNLALNNLSFTIKSGEKVAICGKSGSGKSSTLLLLLRLLDPLPSCSTNITIDTLPLHKIDRSILRERIIAIPQDPVFLPDGSSFMANLDPFESSTEEECISVLSTVGLWDLVAERGGLPGGLVAGALSGGQRSLFGVARAVLRGRIRSKLFTNLYGTNAVVSEEGNEKGVRGSVVKQSGILLLDEISSSVDQETDRLMQRVIMEEFRDYTILMVSHRLEMVTGFDRVIVMDRGCVVEDGRPEELRDSDGGAFAGLWRAAAGW